MGGGKNGRMIPQSHYLAGEDIHFGQPINLIAKELHSNRMIELIRRKNLHHVPRTRKVPRTKLISLRSYWISTSRSSTCSRSTAIPGRSEMLIL